LSRDHRLNFTETSMRPVAGIALVRGVALLLLFPGCGEAPTQDVIPPPPASDIPLTARTHMDAATLAVYNRIRGRQGWILGVAELGTAQNPFLTVPDAQVLSRWTELYGPAAGVPASVEWEMAERNQRVANRDWESLKEFARSGGLPWIQISLNNFTIPFTPGSPPLGGMNDTRDRAAAVLAPGAARDSFVSYVRQLAVEVRAVGKPVVFRPFHEANGTWFWWGGNAADLKSLWRLTFDTFQQQDAKNVIWMWAAGDNCALQCNVASFYPGDDVVDILALDVYFAGDAIPASARTAMAIIATLGPDKPIMLGEFGPAATASFWQSAAAEMAALPRFRGFSLWFARGWQAWGGSAGAGSLIDGTTPAATRAAFDAFLRDPRVVSLARWTAS
jgi:hypothetical protein